SRVHPTRETFLQQTSKNRNREIRGSTAPNPALPPPPWFRARESRRDLRKAPARQRSAHLPQTLKTATPCARHTCVAAQSNCCRLHHPDAPRHTSPSRGSGDRAAPDAVERCSLIAI